MLNIFFECILLSFPLCETAGNKQLVVMRWYSLYPLPAPPLSVCRALSFLFPSSLLPGGAHSSIEARRLLFQGGAHSII